VKAIWQGYFVGADYMLMGSNADGTYGFQTPLATKHAFNGWDEIFLTTPATGLQSMQFNIGGQVLGVNLVAKYYDFKSDYKDLSYGHEWDLSATYPISPQWLVGAEYADYTARDLERIPKPAGSSSPLGIRRGLRSSRVHPKGRMQWPKKASSASHCSRISGVQRLASGSRR
jgi:hypothetical protein